MKKANLQSNIAELGQVRVVTYRAGTKEVLRVTPWSKNLVLASLSTGLGLIARRLAGDETYDVIITSGEIGSDDSATTEGMTDLVDPVVTGIQLADTSFTAKQTVLQFFLPDAELPDGTYAEFLIRCGTQAFARAVISPAFTKATNEDSTVEYLINHNNVA